MRKYILSIVLFLSFSSLYSQKYLNIVKMDNSVQVFDLFTTELRFSEIGDLIVRQGSDADIQISFSDVKEIKFATENITGLSNSKKEDVFIFQQDNNLYIKGLVDSGLMSATIYNVMGQIMLSKSQSSAEPINIALLQSGIYILKLNNKQTIKFVKR
jgi:hypothetical protein